MAYTVILHMINEDPVLAEMEELPRAGDTSVIVSNMRKRDGTRLAYVEGEAEQYILPWHRITFIEVMPSDSERAKVVKFFRE